MTENKRLPPATNAVTLPAHWIGRPMNSLRFRTILANLRRAK